MDCCFLIRDYLSYLVFVKKRHQNLIEIMSIVDTKHRINYTVLALRMPSMCTWFFNENGGDL